MAKQISKSYLHQPLLSPLPTRCLPTTRLGRLGVCAFSLLQGACSQILVPTPGDGAMYIDMVAFTSNAAFAASSLGVMPSSILALPVASMPISAALPNPIYTAPAVSTSTPSLASIPSTTLSASEALTAMLASLALNAALTPQGDRVPLGSGLPTITKQLQEKIQRWEYVDLADLLPAPSTYDSLVTTPARFAFFPGCEFVRPRKQQIESILDWVQVFVVFSAALAKKHPEAMMELLAKPAYHHTSGSAI